MSHLEVGLQSSSNTLKLTAASILCSLCPLTEASPHAVGAPETGQNQAEEGTSSQRPDGQPGVSAFEAAFGALEVQPRQQVQGMDIDADPTRPRWKQLFDAPSHALPAPTALAQAFLRLVTTE